MKKNQQNNYLFFYKSYKIATLTCFSTFIVVTVIVVFFSIFNVFKFERERKQMIGGDLVSLNFIKIFSLVTIKGDTFTGGPFYG